MVDNSRIHESSLSLIEDLLVAENFEAALLELDAVRRYLTPASDYFEKAKFFFLQASCLYNLGRHQEALLKIKVAARFARRLADDSLFASVKLLYGRVLVRLGRLTDAAQEFNESYVFYRRTGDHKSVLFPLNSLAQLHYISGDFRRACEVLELSISYARKYYPQKNVDIDRRNLARVLLYMGSLSEARSILDTVDSTASDQWDQADLQMLMGLLHLLRLDFVPASENLNTAFDLFHQLSTKRDVSVCQEYLGLLYYYLDNYDKAIEYYQQVLDTPEPTASAVAQTLRMLTDVYISKDMFQEALNTAKKAEEAIDRIGEKRERGALHRAYGQIYTNYKEHDTARDYFGKSIALLREIGARYELALTYFACGESKSFDFEKRKRHLESARLLFDEMGVPKRVEQVQSTIDELKVQSVPDTVISHRATSREMIVASPEMKRLVLLAKRYAKSDTTILLTGDTGVGKDVFARYIHDISGRDGEFVPFNSATTPPHLIEAELFGYGKCKFTGVPDSKMGLIEKADGGTFFLNEIANATPELQAKLLEVVETREIRRLGENNRRKVNFRLIAATNSDLKHEMKNGKFRPDLYYRLNKLSFVIPPLRERPDDIAPLVAYFMCQHFPSITDDGQVRHVSALSKALSCRRWSGNVRELEAEIEKLCVESCNNIEKMVSLAKARRTFCENEELINTLEETGWNRNETARRLGISEGTVRYRIKKYKL